VPKRSDPLVARVLLRLDGRVLAAHHHHRHDDFWCLPGGMAQPGETLRDAAVRELREEAGLEVEPGGVVWLQDLIHLGVFVVIFSARLRAGQDPEPRADAIGLREDRHLVEVAWRDLDELLEIDFRPADLLRLAASGDLPELPSPER
jgi:8-oxo-dGTP pyrophosphatase MutT (NUDIX family)